ncbi:thiamine pyrophosphate-dependent enzyme [uncultured Nisaea sp.]|uniref:thiamine pyrophosphate-dependent enzyme n=1 Tax=uncultured Nisaea sp. TaxID=538215 RepID=UPI0030EEA186|tara:strand:+ start:210 stop:809 length:600 start_codon:yes stop_codon:yes gene_type:complete
MSNNKLFRRDVVKKLMTARGDALCISGLGSPTWDLAAIDHRPENFYIWGGMGGAAPTGLGLALAQPDRTVWVLTGDGEQLMGVGSFSTIAMQQPKNLAIIVLDNEHYGETGMQAAPTGRGTDLAAMAAGAGISNTMTIRDEAGLDELVSILKEGRFPLVAVIKIDVATGETIMPPRDGKFVKNTFRSAVLGPDEALHPS